MNIFKFSLSESYSSFWPPSGRALPHESRFATALHNIDQCMPLRLKKSTPAWRRGGACVAMRCVSWRGAPASLPPAPAAPRRQAALFAPLSRFLARDVPPVSRSSTPRSRPAPFSGCARGVRPCARRVQPIRALRGWCRRFPQGKTSPLSPNPPQSPQAAAMAPALSGAAGGAITAPAAGSARARFTPMDTPTSWLLSRSVPVDVRLVAASFVATFALGYYLHLCAHLFVCFFVCFLFVFFLVAASSLVATFALGYYLHLCAHLFVCFFVVSFSLPPPSPPPRSRLLP